MFKCKDETAQERDNGKQDLINLDTFLKIEESFNYPNVEIKREPILPDISNSSATSNVCQKAKADECDNSTLSSPKCLIIHTTEYNCEKCSFSTESVKEAVLHYLHNTSETKPVFTVTYDKNKYNFECDTCDFTTHCQQAAKLHWEQHLSNISLNCFICSYSTREDNLLKAHLVCHLNSMKLIKSNKTYKRKKALVCICGVDIMSANMDHVQRHYLRTHVSGRYVCGHCPSHKYYYYDYFTRHVDRAHSLHESLNRVFSKKERLLENKVRNCTKKKNKCTYCSFTTSSTKQLSEHIEKDHSDQLKHLFCYLCNYSFLTKDSLIAHIQHVHTSTENKLECMNCDFKTRNKLLLKEHMEYHTGNFSQLCDICGFQNANKKTMKIHIMGHDVNKNVSCNQCNFKCKNNFRLNIHIKLMHSDMRGLYACDLCDGRYNSRVVLKRHRQTHIEIKSNMKLHKCHLCNYTAVFKHSIKNHLRTHSTMREQFCCQECGKAYASKNTLNQHMLKVHLKIISNQCTKCNSNFVTSHGLRNHMKRHTGEGRMYCLDCNYSSFHKSNFTKHVNSTCSKSRHESVNLRKCHHCSFASSHRSNFILHVSRCYKKHNSLPA